MRFKNINFSQRNMVFVIHNKGEYLSDLIFKENTFYELDHLEVLHYLPIKKSGLFIDIGANIGNHTLYYSKIMNRDIFAFEPVKENFRLLKRNILMNKGVSKVKCFNFALSNTHANVSMRQNYENNSGTWSIVNASNGDIATKKLDSVISSEDVAYIKIDVEGEELNVLQGAKETIIRCMPIISAEFYLGKEFEKINSFLVQLGYRSAFVVGRSDNAIFIHSSTISSEELIILQNFIDQLKQRNSLNPQVALNNIIKKSISKKKFAYSFINQKKNQDKQDEVKYYDKDSLLEKAFLKTVTLNKTYSDDIIEPDLIAKMIKDKLAKNSEKIIINFTQRTFDNFNCITISKNYKISILSEIIFSQKISRKTLTDIIRYLQNYMSKSNLFIVIDLEEEQLEIAHELFELNQIAYGIIVSNVIPLHWEKWSWLSNARFIYANDLDVYKQFSLKYIFNIELKENIELKQECFLPFKANIVSDNRVQKRGLLLSYYYEPSLSVGIFRPSYWFNNIKEISNEEIHLELVTAMSQIPSQKNIHYIQDYGSVTGVTTDANLKKEHEKIKNMVNTVGLSWTQSLKDYFDSHPELKYDFVILTGNPFMHFYFSDYAKKRWGAKIIQDYRDPLGKNPRFYSKDPEITKRNEIIRQRYEDEFCSKSDIVVTVNEICKADMSVMSPQPVEIIGNGYNDKVIDKIDISKMSQLKERFPILPFKRNKFNVSLLFKKTKKRSPNKQVVRLCYAGSFAHDRKPENLIQSVKNVLGYELHHFGTPYHTLALSKNKRLVSHGKKPYDEVIASLMCMNIGVVYCSHDFESTTKIYDYIACDMVILVITSEENPKPYNLSKELEGLEYVYWVVNTEKAITNFLVNSVLPEQIKRPQREKFSRKEGTKKLINLIKRKENG